MYIRVYIYIYTHIYIIIHIIPLDLRERVNTSIKLFGPKQYSRRTHCQGRGWWWGQDSFQLLQPSHACRPQQVCACTIPSLRESGGSGYSVQFNKFLSSPFPPFQPFPNSTTDALLKTSGFQRGGARFRKAQGLALPRMRLLCLKPLVLSGGAAVALIFAGLGTGVQGEETRGKKKER